MVVLLLPTKESFSTYVSFEPLKGVCFLSKSRALMHSFKARSDLLISAPSIEVFLSLCMVSAPLSEPARSIKLIFEYSDPLCLSTICMTAWDLELWSLAPVFPEDLSAIPTSRVVMISYTLVTGYSVRFTMFTFYLPSSRQKTCPLLFSKSQSLPQ